MGLVDVIEIGQDRVEIWQVDTNDFVVYYVTYGIMARGSLLEIMQDIHTTYAVFDMGTIGRPQEMVRTKRE